MRLYSILVLCFLAIVLSGCQGPVISDDLAQLYSSYSIQAKLVQSVGQNGTTVSFVPIWYKDGVESAPPPWTTRTYVQSLKTAGGVPSNLEKIGPAEYQILGTVPETTVVLRVSGVGLAHGSVSEPAWDAEITFSIPK